MNDGVVQHDRTGTDERPVVHDASLEVGKVTDRDIAADLRRRERRGVDDGTVLDRRVLSDDDRAVVAADHSLRPHRRARTEHDIADDGRVRVDVRRLVDLGDEVAERVDRHHIASYVP